MAEIIDELKIKLYEEQAETIAMQNEIISSQNEMINKMFRITALMLTVAELDQLKIFEKLQRTQNLKNALERAEQ